MRILLMIASLAESGGAEMLVRNLSLAYSQLGHTCHIAYISNAQSLGANAEYERRFKAEMEEAGVGFTELGFACRKLLPVGALRLRQVIAKFRPDVFHVHLPYGLLFQALGLSRVPTVYTHHNTIFKFPPKLFRLFDRFVARYIAICKACESLLQPYVGRPIELIYNGVPDLFEQGGIRIAPAAEPTILSVGNLTTQKNYTAIVAIARRLCDRFRKRGAWIRFQIAGEGPHRGAIEAAIAEAGMQGSIELLGARSDVAALMAKADLMLNFSDFEGLPISLIEAARSGLPTVATCVGGSPEVVNCGRTGTLVPAGDITAAVTAIDELLADPGRYNAYSAAAIERSQRFDLVQCVQAHLRLYAEVVAQ